MSNTAYEMTEKFRADQGASFIEEEEEGGAVQFPCCYKLGVLR